MPVSRAWRWSQQIESYAEGSEWIPEMRVRPFYNSNNTAQIDSMHMDSWEESIGDWIPNVMVSYISYNNAGRITQNEIRMNVQGMLFPILKLTATFDNQNRITHMYMYRTEMGLRVWIPMSRIHLVYLNGGCVEVYGWEEAEQYDRQSPYFHTTFVCDENGRVMEEHSVSSADSVNWVTNNKQLYQYHAQDTTTGPEFIEYMSQSLPIMMMNDNNFMLPGLITQLDIFYWDGGQWIPENHEEITYNSQLQKIMHNVEYYDNQNWYTEHRINYFYDDNGNLSYEIEQVPMYDTLTDTSRMDYSWEQYGTSVEDLISVPNLVLNAYPSPFRNEVNLVTESKDASPIDIGIYNLRGQLIRKYSSKPGQVVVWNGTDKSGKTCPTGIYFLKVNQNGNTVSSKLIKIK
jgi:hypothetical protein